LSNPAPDFLVLEHIRKEFGSFVALKDVSLAVRPGELLCFLGPSGCGKTTLLRIIAGLEVQSAGRIVQAGRDISLLPPMKRDYGIVFQSYALFPNLSVADNVAYGLVNRRVARAKREARVAELLALVGMPDSGPKFPAQLSGGQQQRVAIARALATSPGLMLLDEPLSALDARVRVRLRGEIRGLQQRLGITTILVTHDQEEALSMADRVAVMSRGRIEQVSPPVEIYDQPETLFVNQFVGTTNTFDGVVELATGGHHTVRLASGERLEGHASAAVSPGQAVTVSIRPEQMQLTPGPDGSGNAVAGTIAAALPLGPIVLYDIRRGDGSAFKVSLPRDGGVPILPVGQTVFARPTGPARYRMFSSAPSTH